MTSQVARLHARNRLVQALRDARDAADAVADPDPDLAGTLKALVDEAEERRDSLAQRLEPEIRAFMRSRCYLCLHQVRIMNGTHTLHETADGGRICESAREALILAGQVVVGVGELQGSSRGGAQRTPALTTEVAR